MVSPDHLFSRNVTILYQVLFGLTSFPFPEEERHTFLAVIEFFDRKEPHKQEQPNTP
jgi:hypothetical protein